MFAGINFEEIKKKDCVSNFTDKSVESFYKTVERYMKSNYLCENNQDIFYIQVGEDVFEVGFIFWNDEFYYIKKVLPKEGTKIYKLEDVLANRISEKERLIKEKIDLINKKVGELKEEGVPFKLIKSSIQMNKEWY